MRGTLRTNVQTFKAINRTFVGNDLPDRASQISRLLKSWREAAGLSQEQAAAKLGISGKTISRWERDKHPPSGDLLIRAATLYGADMSELGEGSGNVNVPRGTGRVSESRAEYGAADEDSWSPNPALARKIPPRAYDVAIAYCRRLQSGGWPREEIEQIERLMIDPRYAQANKRKGHELSEDDYIMLIDATWEAVKHSAAALGRQV